MHDEAKFEETIRTIPIFHSGLVEQALTLGRDRAVKVLERLLFDATDQNATGAFAARLLVRIGGEDVINVLLRALTLADNRRDALLGELAMEALIGLGPPVTDKALALAESTTSRDLTALLCNVVVSVGAKGPRVYALCVKTLEWNPGAAATLLRALGEPLGVVELRRLIDDRHMGRRRIDPQTFFLLADAFDALGGTLTEQDIAVFTHLEAASRKPKKTRRNELCPCGSGKKLKRCHPELRANGALN